ncbi:MAG: hypothetical protein Kow00120_15150 [Anaerolineae bacterium]
MAEESVVNAVRRIPLFSRLGKHDLQRLAGAFQREHYPPYSTVFQQGEVTRMIYIMMDGAGVLLQVDEDNVERRVGAVRSGDVTDVSALFFDDDWPHTLLVTREATFYTLSRARFDSVAPYGSDIRRRLNFDAEPELKKRLDARPFAWLRPGEYVVVSTRRHIWAFVRKAIGALALMALMLMLLLGISIAQVEALACVFAPGFVLAIVLPALLAGFFYLDWRNDYFVVTNQRVVHEERTFVILGEMTIDQAPLRNVQNVNIAKEGIAERSFGFGSVLIDTAGLGRVVFDMAPDPEMFRDVILELSQRAERRTAAERRYEIRGAIEGRLGGVRLRQEGPEANDLEGEASGEDADAGAFAPAPARSWLSEAWQNVREYLSPRVRVERDGIVTYRKHWWVLFLDVWKPATVFTLLHVLVITRLTDAWPAFLLPLAQAFSVTGTAALYLILLPFVLFWLWWGYEDWRNDLFQVTPTSVIDSKMQPLFFGEKRSLQAPLDNIQNVSAETPNFWSRLVSMGTVIIQTAGVEGTLEWQYIYNPFAVAEDVLRRVRAFQQAEAEEREQAQLELLAEWFAIYHQTTHPEEYAYGDEDARFRNIEDEDEDEPPEEARDEYALF